MKIFPTPSVIVFGALLLLGAAPVSRLSAAMQPIANTTATGVVGELDWGYAWNDTQQNAIRSQGGSIVQVGSGTGATYYWYGFDFDSNSQGPGGTNTPTYAPVYYTSTDLSNWTFGGSLSLLGLPTTTNPVPTAANYHGRPRVVYNSGSGYGYYVMVVQGPAVSGQNTLCFFTASQPQGPFTLQSTQQIMNSSAYTAPNNTTVSTAGDHNLFVDTDGTAYLVCACADGGQINGTILIIKLSASYLTQVSVASTLTYNTVSDAREAPCIFARTNPSSSILYYYLFTSRTNSWFGSQTQYATATSMSGPWSIDASPNSPTSPAWTSSGTSSAYTVNTSPAWGDSFGTQNNMVISLSGSNGVTTNSAAPTALGYICAGDRWVNKLGYGSGRHEWDVLTFDTSTVPVPTMNHYDLFYLNVAGTTVAGGTDPVTSTTTNAGPPCVPSNVVAIDQTSSIKLTWTATPGAATYTLRRATVTGGVIGSYGPPLWSGGTGYSATDNTITVGTTYAYLLSAVNSAGAESLVSNNPQVEANNSSFGQVAKPTGVTASINSYESSGQILVSWTAVTGAAYYNVARSTISGGPYTVLSPLKITGTSFNDSSVTPGMTYYYVVYASNWDSATNLTSGWSAASAESPAFAAPPGSQIFLTAALLPGNSVAISWQRDLTSLTFNIYRATSANPASWGTAIGTVDSTSFVDTPPGGATYWYKVLGTTNAGTVLSGDNPSHPSVYVP